MSKKILIIEDEDVLGRLLNNKLIEQGYEVVWSKDGQDGYEQIESFSPDLILLDIILPKMNGFEVLEKMRLSDNLKRIPVIVISNSGQPVEIERAQQMGVKDWLVKTEFDPEEVVDKVTRQLSK